MRSRSSAKPIPSPTTTSWRSPASRPRSSRPTRWPTCCAPPARWWSSAACMSPCSRRRRWPTRTRSVSARARSAGRASSPTPRPGELDGIYRSQPEEFDLARSPMPAFDLLDLDRYNRITVQTSRGCPRRCSFCASSILLTHGYKLKPAVRVLAEIDRICARWPRPFIEFADDNALLNKPHWRALLPGLAERKVRWFAESDLSVARDETFLDELREGGCKQILIGLESPFEPGLRDLELRSDWKRKQADRAREAVRRIQGHGIRVTGCFIIGLDGHTTGIFRRRPRLRGRDRSLRCPGHLSDALSRHAFPCLAQGTGPPDPRRAVEPLHAVRHQLPARPDDGAGTPRRIPRAGATALLRRVHRRPPRRFQAALARGELALAKMWRAKIGERIQLDLHDAAEDDSPTNSSPPGVRTANRKNCSWPTCSKCCVHPRTVCPRHAPGFRGAAAASGSTPRDSRRPPHRRTDVRDCPGRESCYACAMHGSFRTRIDAIHHRGGVSRGRGGGRCPPRILATARSTPWRARQRDTSASLSNSRPSCSRISVVGRAGSTRAT